MSTATSKYRYFIQDTGCKEFARKGYHYQATATSLNELWAKIGAQLDHYNRNVSSAWLDNGIRRDLKAGSLVVGAMQKIGNTSDGKQIFVQRLGSDANIAKPKGFSRRRMYRCAKCLEPVYEYPGLVMNGSMLVCECCQSVRVA